MPPLLSRWLPEISFLRKLSMLVGGTLVGQLLIILSSPLLTRLFTPEAFGLFAVFAALAGILGATVGLRFEFAVPVPPDEQDAAALVVITILAAGLMALLQVLLIWLFGAWFVTAVGWPALAIWLWLLPAATLIWGSGSALTHWSIRRQTYRVNGLNRTLYLSSQAGGQVASGLLGAGAGGLILGYLVGYGVRLGHLLWHLSTSDRRLLSSQRLDRLRRNVREHWRYPAFALPSGLLQSLCELAPVFFIAILYGPIVAGWYDLSRRVMALPMHMLSQVASQVFLGELRGLDREAVHRLFLRTLTLFAGLGVLGMLPILLFAPELFEFVFGEPWREAGDIVRLLIPLYFVRFIVQPISQLLYALRRQAVHLLSSSLNGLALAGSFTVGYILQLEASTTLLLFSSSSSLSSLLYLVISWRLARAPAMPATTTR